MIIDEIKRNLSETLKPKRYNHTLSVAELAQVIIEKLNITIDPEKMELAALLHDCAKGMSIDDQIQYAKDNKVPLSLNDLYSKGVIHARVGRHMAQHQFGIQDPQILQAIYIHPTGNEWMSEFDKVLYAADYLDPNRKLKESAELLEIIMNDFEEGVFRVILRKNRYVEKKRKYIHPASIAFYNKQLKLLESR